MIRQGSAIGVFLKTTIGLKVKRKSTINFSAEHRHLTWAGLTV